MAIDIEELKAMMQAPQLKKQSYAQEVQQEGNTAREDTAPDFVLDEDGEEYMPVGVSGVLAASEKLLAINRGITDTDERDSLKFQKVFRPDSMLRESIKMDADKVLRQAMYQAAKRKNLNGLNSGAFDGYVRRLLIGNPLTSPLEEINPMQLVANARRITKMGPGGLGSDRSITEEAQAVHPSQYGFISVIEGPECFVETDDYKGFIFTKKGWIPITKMSMEDEYACLIEGRVKYHKPLKVIHEPYTGACIAYNDNKVKFLVTYNHRFKIAEQEYMATASEIYNTQVTIPCTPDPSGENKETCRKLDSKHWSATTVPPTMIHCAAVPGGMLFVSYNNCPGFWTGNSQRAGIDVRAAWGTKLGSDGRIYQKFYDRRRKKMRWMSPMETTSLVMKFPD